MKKCCVLINHNIILFVCNNGWPEKKNPSWIYDLSFFSLCIASVHWADMPRIFLEGLFRSKARTFGGGKWSVVPQCRFQYRNEESIVTTYSPFMLWEWKNCCELRDLFMCTTTISSMFSLNNETLYDKQIQFASSFKRHTYISSNVSPKRHT